MNRIFLIFYLSLSTIFSYSQNSSDFEKNRNIISQFMNRSINSDDVKKVDIGSAMIKKMATKLSDRGNNKSAELLRSISSINILIDSGEKRSEIIQRDMLELPKKCHNYELISSIEKRGELSKFYFVSHEGGDNCEFLMLVRSDTKNIILYITGGFSIQDISALSSFSKDI